MFVDPNCNLWSSDDNGKVYSFEVCDPVEAPTYVVSGVSVSNFVTPAWFDPLASRKSKTQFDKLGHLHSPFSILKWVRRLRTPGQAAPGVRSGVPHLAQGHEARARIAHDAARRAGGSL